MLDEIREEYEQNIYDVKNNPHISIEDKILKLNFLFAQKNRKQNQYFEQINKEKEERKKNATIN